MTDATSKEVVMSTQTETVVDQSQTHKTKKPTPRKSTVGKTDLVLRSLNRKAGASVDELCKLTNWQPHSVRGFLSGTVRKKLGFEVSKRNGANGITRYYIVKS
jgi:Protein of unknown function (DUF3489)